MVLFEGTNLSEGRGTARPFQFIGSPAIKDGQEYKNRVENLLGEKPEGLFLRPTTFQPTFHKWQGEICHGLDLVVTNHQKIRSFKLALAMLRAGIELMDDAFRWAQPPYEYNEKDLPINLLLGDMRADQKLMDESFSCHDLYWQRGMESYLSAVKDTLYYPREMKCN